MCTNRKEKQVYLAGWSGILLSDLHNKITFTMILFIHVNTAITLSNVKAIKHINNNILCNLV